MWNRMSYYCLIGFFWWKKKMFLWIKWYKGKIEVKILREGRINEMWVLIDFGVFIMLNFICRGNVEEVIFLVMCIRVISNNNGLFNDKFVD